MHKLAAFLRAHRLALVGVISVGYLLLFPWLYRTFGDGVVTLSLVPVMLAGWFCGLRVGLTYSLAAFALNLLLVILISKQPLALLVTDGVAAGSLVLFFLGGVVGYLSDLKKKLAEELANRRQVEKALRVSETFNQAVLQALSANIAVLNRTGEIVAVNGAWTKFARDNGAQEERNGVGMNYLQVCRSASGDGADVAERTAVGIQSVLEGRESLFTLEYACHSPRQKRWFVLHVTPLTHDQGGAVVSHINITDRVQSEQKLVFLATHDALTGLYNRAFFDQELARLQEDTVGGANRVGEDNRVTPVSVMMADVDGLKLVNDRFGHAAGDDLLRRAADVLRSAFRDHDILARIGGDEFAVVLPGVDEKLAQVILERVARRMSAAAVAEGSPPLRMSLGVATAWKSEEIMDALKQADEKMYAEKVARR